MSDPYFNGTPQFPPPDGLCDECHKRDAVRRHADLMRPEQLCALLGQVRRRDRSVRAGLLRRGLITLL